MYIYICTCICILYSHLILLTDKYYFIRDNFVIIYIHTGEGRHAIHPYAYTVYAYTHNHPRMHLTHKHTHARI